MYVCHVFMAHSVELQKCAEVN